MVGIQFSYFPLLHHFLFVNMTDGGLSHEGQLDFTFLKKINLRMEQVIVIYVIPE